MKECDCQTLQQRITELEQTQKDILDRNHHLSNVIQACLIRLRILEMALEKVERHDND